MEEIGMIEKVEKGFDFFKEKREVGHIIKTDIGDYWIYHITEEYCEECDNSDTSYGWNNITEIAKKIIEDLEGE